MSTYTYNPFPWAAEQRARQFLDKGEIEADKVVLLAEDVLSLAAEVWRLRGIHRAALIALAGDGDSPGALQVRMKGGFPPHLAEQVEKTMRDIQGGRA